MAILSVKRIADSRSRETNRNYDGPIDLVFRVRTSDPLDGQSVVLAAVDPVTSLSIPQGGDSYGPPWVSTAEQAAMQAKLDNTGEVSGCACIRRRVQQDGDDANAWMVTATFASSSPVMLPTKVRFDSSEVKIAQDRDRGGNLIRNSYGDAFANTLEIPSGILTMVVEVNTSSYSKAFMAAFLGDNGNGGAGTPINDSAWWGYAAGTVRLARHGCELMNDIDQPAPYFRQSFTFEIQNSGWQHKPLDCGYRGFDVNGVVCDPFFGKTTGQPRSQPTLLNGGIELDQGDPPVFLDFDVFPERDFGALNLTQPTELP